MERIRYFADQSNRRACGFGFLAIATGMVALYWDMAVAFKLGATGVSFMVAILLWKAFDAGSRRYKHTEVYLLMDKRHDLPEERAQQVFSTILRERYLWHATMAAIAATAMWAMTFVMQLLGRPPGGI
jgi:hypothetical protein